jgi:hypothetical protein
MFISLAHLAEFHTPAMVAVRGKEGIRLAPGGVLFRQAKEKGHRSVPRNAE